MRMPDYVQNWRENGPPGVTYADRRIQIGDPQDAVDLLQSQHEREFDFDRAYAWALHLTISGRAMALTNLSVGDVRSTLTEPREVLRDGLLNNAAMVMVLEVRPHFSGPDDVGGEEMQAWHRVWQSGRIVGLPILDHLLVGRNWVWCSLSRMTR